MHLRGEQIVARTVLRTLARTVKPEHVATADLVAQRASLAEVRQEDVSAPGPNGPVPLRVYTPTRPNGIGFVWAHGGAYMFGDLDGAEAHWVSLMLADAGVTVVSTDYRKALRGGAHPVLMDDVHAAWDWANVSLDQLGITADRLHLGGASAGATLTAGVVKRLRASGRRLPASLVQVYALLHLHLPEPSDDLAASLAAAPPPFRFTPKLVRWLGLNWAGAAYRDDPTVFAALGDLAGMPPTLVLNADADELRASAEAFGAGLADAGVTVEVDTVRGTFHGFLAQTETDAAIDGVGRIVVWLSVRDAERHENAAARRD